MKRMRLDPRKFGFAKASPTSYAGGDLATNRKIALTILNGQLKGPRRDIVLLNSGFALWLAGVTASIREGIEKSHWVIRTGRALGVLEELKQITHERN